MIFSFFFCFLGKDIWSGEALGLWRSGFFFLEGFGVGVFDLVCLWDGWK